MNGYSQTALHVGMIRRAIVYSPAAGYEKIVNSLRRLLSGMELNSIPEHYSEALLTALPASDKMVSRYVRCHGASIWSTVTPMILPGRDDRKEKKVEKLLRKAILQAGYSPTLAEYAALDWRAVGYHHGAAQVKSYANNVPLHLKPYPRYHVRIQWRNSDGVALNLLGPLVLGGGRYVGLGLFIADK